MDVITADKDCWVDVMMKEELNMTKEDKSPFMMGFMTFISFILVGFIPLIAYVWDYSAGTGMAKHSADQLFATSIILTSLAFLGIGWLKSYVTEANRIRSILETLFLGATAAVLSYFVGNILEGMIS